MKKYFIITIIIISFLLAVSKTNFDKTSNIPIATAISNNNSEKVDVKIDQKVYSCFFDVTENTAINKENVVALYIEENAFFNKTIWFYSIPNLANCDLILDSKYHTLFCVSEDLEKAKKYYNDYNNYNFYKSSFGQEDDDISISDMESLKVKDTSIFERFYHYNFADEKLVQSFLVEIPDDYIKNRWIVSAISNDGLIRRDFIFVETDDGVFLEILVNAGMDSVSGIKISTGDGSLC